MKIVLVGTLKALETFNQIYNEDVRVIDIIKDLHKTDEQEYMYRKIKEGC